MVEYLCVVAPAFVNWLEEELCHAYVKCLLEYYLKVLENCAAALPNRCCFA